ncbi:hypothetical protein NAEX_02256 [Nannocystis exedens]|nr:hypothetical protein NAEX_02256 [Nannocystis exedens]
MESMARTPANLAVASGVSSLHSASCACAGAGER